MSDTCTCNNTDIYLPESATLLRKEQMTELEQFYEFKLDSGKPLGHMPGQFVEVSMPGIGEAPISVSSSPTSGDTFEMVVRNVGNVTNAMHNLSEGDKVGIRGPFGTDFPVDGAMKGKDLLFICGGIGLVPVRSAIQYVFNKREDYGRVAILFGAKDPSNRLFTDELAMWAKEKDVTLLETVDHRDENWTGIEGVITKLIPLVQLDAENTVSVICGPPIMYKFVITELLAHKFDPNSIFLSLERNMKCGVGKCGHCQINNLYVCQDGPVFNFADVEDIEEAI